MEMLKLGCYFSINYPMLRTLGSSLGQVPLNRILIETDHPTGDQFFVRARQPGNVRDVEWALARCQPALLQDGALQDKVLADGGPGNEAPAGVVRTW
ncbi:TatD family hydrolase [Arthrobacter sp. C152]